MSRQRRGNRQHGGLFPGLIMMALGTVFLLERFHVISTRQIWRLWPVTVIAFGLTRLLWPAGGRRSIFWLLIGIWLQISTLRLFGLDFDDSWPLLIIFVGASFVFDALLPASDGAAAWPDTKTSPAPSAPIEMGASPVSGGMIEPDAQRGGGDEK